MPSVDDIIELKLISEQQGVQMSTTTYWQIEDLGADGPIQGELLKFATAWVDAYRAQLSVQWAVTCVIFNNVTEVSDPVIPAFTNEAGGELTVGPHPTSNVVCITRYCLALVGGALKHGSIRISGLHKDVSKTGRVESDMELGTLENFLTNSVLLPSGGWQITPLLRYRLTVGPPPTYDYAPVVRAITQGVFRKLNSRGSTLCGTA